MDMCVLVCVCVCVYVRVFQILAGLMSCPRSDIQPLFCVSPSLNDHVIHRQEHQCRIMCLD